MGVNLNRNVVNNNQNLLLKRENALLVEQGPSDSISELCWSNESNPNFISAASWDKTVRIWEIQFGLNNSIKSFAKILFQHTAPVLSSCFKNDNTKFFAGGCDNLVKMYDLNAGDTQGIQVAQHDQPISKIARLHPFDLLVTVSWDGFVKMWDCRSPNPVWSRNFQAKILKMDIKHPYMILADNHQKLYAFDFSSSLDGPLLQMNSVLSTQIRSICLFPSSSPSPGAVIGSMEGRCGIIYFDEHSNTKKEKGFCFKSNRQDIEKGMINVYSVNAIDFFANSNETFVTAGSDGKMTIWHKGNRSRLKAFEAMATSITDCKCNLRKSILAFAESYDWHKGDDPIETQKKINNIFIYLLKDEDLLPKKT